MRVKRWQVPTGPLGEGRGDPRAAKRASIAPQEQPKEAKSGPKSSQERPRAAKRGQELYISYIRAILELHCNYARDIKEPERSYKGATWELYWSYIGTI